MGARDVLMGCIMQAGKQRKGKGTRLGLWGEVERWVPGKHYLAYIRLYSGSDSFWVMLVVLPGLERYIMGLLITGRNIECITRFVLVMVRESWRVTVDDGTS